MLPPLSQGQPRQIEVDLTHAKQIQCKCGGKIFLQGINLFSISAIVSPTGQDLIANKPLLYCARCFEPAGPESTFAEEKEEKEQQEKATGESKIAADGMERHN
jgi:hypothetical protein